MKSIDPVNVVWTLVSVGAQTAATATALSRPDLIGALHFFAFAIAAGGLMSVLYHKEADPHPIRRMVVGTLLAGLGGMAAGMAWAEWTSKGNVAMAVSVAVACLIVWGVSGRDIFAVLDRLVSLWRRRRD